MNGKTFQAAETQIILKTSAGPVERFAAEELRRALREISGSAPPVQTEGKPGGFSIELETLGYISIYPVFAMAGASQVGMGLAVVLLASGMAENKLRNKESSGKP